MQSHFTVYDVRRICIELEAMLSLHRTQFTSIMSFECAANNEQHLVLYVYERRIVCCYQTVLVLNKLSTS